MKLVKDLEWSESMSYEEFCRVNKLEEKGENDYALNMFNFLNEKYIYEKYELSQ